MVTKVLHVLTTLDPKAGGVSQAVRSIVNGLNAHGVINECVTLDEPGINYGDEFTCYKLGPGKTKWSYSAALSSWLKTKLKDYDVAVLHGLWQYSSIALANAITYAPATRIYVMPHGMLDPYFQRAGHRKLKAIRNNILWRFAESRVIRKATGLLFTCEMERVLAKETFAGYQPASEFVTGLPIGRPPAFMVPMADEFRLATGISVDQPFWLYLSRIDEKKGVDLLIKSYLDLRTKYSDVPALLIAGPGLETSYGQEMRALASASDKILFGGMLSGGAKWWSFYGCQLFILPSHQENFGIVVAEALACGKPVLITDKVNIYQEIESGGAGIVVPDTVDGITSGLVKWLNKSAAEQMHMANAAVPVFNEYYESEKQIRRFKELLNTPVR